MIGREPPHGDDSAAPVLGESRSRVLAVLQGSSRPLGVSEVAEHVGLHANTARFHLDALVRDGVAERSSEEREQPGRPRALYTARADVARVGKRSYRLLAEILASYLDGETARPADAAVRAGKAWGHYLADRPPPFRRVDANAATEHLVTALNDIGFEPEPVATGRRRQIRLHHCPFREIAEDHRDVICSVHLGLMQGMLAEFDAPIDTERLEPFVEPNLCVAHLGNRKSATRRG